MKVKFSECVMYMIKGPFGSDMKKSLYVPKSEDTYKVYVQGNAIQKDEDLGDYYVSSEYFHQKLERFQVHPGDYIITCDGTLGKYIKLSENIEPGVISSSLLLLKLDENKIYNKYFELLWDNSMLKYLASQARNACLVHLPSAKAIGDVEIILPEMSVQREIADKASAVRGIIEKRIEEVSLLDNLIKARFVELFGNPFDTTKWPVKELKDISESMIDGSNVNPDYYESEGDVLFLRIQNVWRNEFRLDDSVYISQEVNHKHYYETSLKTDDLLITKIGRYYTKDSSLGRVSLYRGKDDCANYSNNIMRVRLTDSVNSEFVNALLNLDDYQSYIRRTSKGGTDKRALSKSLIGSYPIIIPPKSLQNEFADFVAQVDKSKFVLKKGVLYEYK